MSKKTRKDSSGKPAVDVIARLNSSDTPVERLRIVRKIGTIVIGQVNINEIETVRENKNILSLRLAEKVHPQVYIKNRGGRSRLPYVFEQFFVSVYLVSDRKIELLFKNNVI